MVKKPTAKGAYGVYCKLPEAVRKHTDKGIKIVAKATKGIRNRAEIERRGEQSKRKIKKILHL